MIQARTLSRIILLILISSISTLSFAGQNSSCSLTFLGTADLQGKLEPAPGMLRRGAEDVAVVGGISRLATLFRQLRSAADGQVFVLSAGDDLMGRYFHSFDGRAIFDLMGAAGYEVLALGNHEFDRGSGILGEALEDTDFTPLCTDLNVEHTALEGSCRPFFIHGDGPVKIGFFSLMTPEFPHVTRSGSISLTGSPSAVAGKMVRKLRGLGVDVIVALTHLGTDLDRKLAAEVPGIDILFGGHSHEYLPDLERVGDTLIVNGGEKGTAVTVLSVQCDTNNKLIPDTAEYRLIPVTAAIPESKDIAAKLRGYTDKLPKSIILGSTDQPWSLEKSTLRNGESSLADMINDIILEKFSVDLVLNNGGAFRGNSTYPPGDISNTRLREIDEFDNDIFLVSLKGKRILEILEHSAASLGHGGFLQVAGIRLTIDPTARPQLIEEQGEQWVLTRPGQRVSEVSVKNRDGKFIPLEAEKTYRIAGNAYLAQQGGDNYYWFPQYGTDRLNTYTSIYSILVEYLDRTGQLNPAATDGRITIKPAP